jgi:hypothetical protein
MQNEIKMFNKDKCAKMEMEVIVAPGLIMKIKCFVRKIK